jgi:hypothetical protein
MPSLFLLKKLFKEPYERYSDYCAVELENGDYRVKYILVRIKLDNNYLERLGIELFKV